MQDSFAQIVLLSLENNPILLLLLSLFSHQVLSNSFATPWTVASQAPLSMGFWSGEWFLSFLIPELFLKRFKTATSILKKKKKVYKTQLNELPFIFKDNENAGIFPKCLRRWEVQERPRTPYFSGNPSSKPGLSPLILNQRPFQLCARTGVWQGRHRGRISQNLSHQDK